MSDSWNPKQYEKFKEERSQPFFDLMSLLQNHEQPEVIDLGCGTGELSALLQQKTNAKRTVGIDNSDQMLSAADSFKNDKLFFRKDVIENFKEEKAFDIVFSNAAIQWCPDHPLLLKRFTAALRPGGQLAIQMPMNHDYPTHTLATEMCTEEPWSRLLNNEKYNMQKLMLSPEDYAKLLFKLGYIEQKVFVRVYGHKLENRDAVIEWVSGTLLTYFKSRFSVDEYKNFVGQYKQRLFEMIPDETPFFYPFKRIFIWGRRP